MNEYVITKQESNEKIEISSCISAQGASKLSLVANLVLLISNFTVYWFTDSVSLLSTAADSFLDLLSQLIIYAAMRSNVDVDKEKWPLGKSRLEPVGLIVVSSLMGIASFQIFIESIYRLVSSNDNKVPNFELPSIILVSIAIGLKTLLFFICWAYRKTSPSMSVLAEDHRNDVLSNVIGLCAGLISNAFPKDAWFADPLGGLLISTYICIRWILVGKEQAMMLVGRVAHPKFLEQVKTMAEEHEAKMKVDVIRAYHFGHRYLVEVEVVVPPESTIIFAHDSALSLQKKIEILEEVERAHVHVDYAHRDEDEHKHTFEISQPQTPNGLHRRHSRYNAVSSNEENTESDPKKNSFSPI